MRKIRTILIDDEQDSANLLRFELMHNCPQIEIIALFNSSEIALKEIEHLNPDLVFLDIEMPKINGFQFLNLLMPIQFKVIFVTAYNQFALKAFRFNALDYLLKPFDVNDLVEAVNKAQQQIIPSQNTISTIQNNIKDTQITKIAVPSQNGISFIEIKDILYAEANNNYTKIIMKNTQTHLLSKTLKDVQEVLEEMHFQRVHRQYIINLNCVKQFFKGESMYLVMENGEKIPVSRSQKENLENRYGWL